MKPLTHLSEMRITLSRNGPAQFLLSNLKTQNPTLATDPLLNSLVWNSLYSFFSAHPRTAHDSSWLRYDEVNEENPYIRGAALCLNVLNAFINNTQYDEKVHASAFLSIKDLSEGEQGTSSGSSLTIQKAQSQPLHGESPPNDSTCITESPYDSAFEAAVAFIIGLKELKEAFRENNEDADLSASLIVDINVMEDLRFERTPQDNNEIIALAIITSYFLLRVSGIESDGSFVKVQRDCPNLTMAPSDEPGGRMLISARWPDLPPSVLKQAHRLRRSWKGTYADFVGLREVINNIAVNEGRRNIIILGRTGSGKSYTGNWVLHEICGDDSVQFIESESGSMTSFVEKLPKTGNFCVWDTPGLDDAYGRDKRYLDDIEKSILEMGTVSVVILCLTTIERIEGSVKQQFASYAKIMGPEISGRLMLFVNRQTKSVNKIQKKNLINALRTEGKFTVTLDQIFDMESTSQNLDKNLQNASQMLLKLCGKPGMKVSYVNRLQQGLLEIQRLENLTVRKEAEDILVKMSAEILWLKFGNKNGRRPLKLQPSWGKSIVLSDRCLYLIKGEKLLIEHVLEIPEDARSLFRRLTVFAWGVGSRNRHVLRLMELVKKMRLVFMEMPSDRRFDRVGLLQKVLKIRYKLWNVRDALAEDVKQHIQKSAGLDGETWVSAFPGLDLPSNSSWVQNV